MIEIGLSLGSNIGDKAGHVRRAAHLLRERGVVPDLAMSRLYRTAPWGGVAQDWFVNSCAVGHTAVAPHDLLGIVKDLEVEIGRTAAVRWGPRVIDVDILYYGEMALDSPGLVIPHREVARRAFVLVPLAELRPQRRLVGRTVAELAAACAGEPVVPLDEAGAAQGGAPSA